MNAIYAAGDIENMNSGELKKLNKYYETKHAMAMGQIKEIFSFFNNLRVRRILKQEGEKMDEESSETTSFI
jgi:hypothetical protein